MSRSAWSRLGRVGLGVVFLYGSSAYAQVVTGAIYGSITDASGAAVPKASVVALNTATGIATRTTADDSGNYTLPSLPPGNYNITVEKQGFKSVLLSGITLQVDQKARVDAHLQVGQLTTTVEVSGKAPLVETKTASVGTVIGEQQVVNLPLNLRRITSLATLVPDTVTGSRPRLRRVFQPALKTYSWALERPC